MTQAAVYLVTNTANGNTYVGVTRFAVEKRWREHCYTANRSPKTRLHRAIAKHGAEAFTITPIATVLDVNEIGAVERAVIESLAPVYNQTNGGEIVVGRRLAPEAVERIARANTGKKRTVEQRLANSRLKLDQYRSDANLRAVTATNLKAARAKVDQDKRVAAIRAAAKEGRMARRQSPEMIAAKLKSMRTPEARAKMTASKRKPVECITLNTTFDSLLDAAEATGIDFGTISSVCLGKRKHTHGLVFQYVRS